MENLGDAGEKALLIALMMAILTGVAQGEVITRLPTQEKVVALTFDACETRSPAFFDRKIVDYLLANEIPATIFVSGRFARRNAAELARLAAYDFIEIENHSLNHPQHMERLKPEEIRDEVLANEQLLVEITGQKPRFFRFPAGNYDQATLAAVEALGYQVVHWTFPSGDPDRSLSPAKLQGWVLSKVRAGSILIFHINGRGYATGAALPQIVSTLQQKGYRFVKLADIWPPPEPEP